jgi:PPOX class probable F420-dependent enzyme
MATRKRSLLDTSTAKGKHVERRLKKEIVIWLATSDAEGSPHAVPVWFKWDGDSFLVYSVPGQKVKDIEANPRVQLHLNTGPEGEDVVRIEGDARRLRRHLPAYKVPDYMRKYRALVKSYGWTPESFSSQYHIALRIRPTKIRIAD